MQSVQFPVFEFTQTYTYNKSEIATNNVKNRQKKKECNFSVRNPNP